MIRNFVLGAVLSAGATLPCIEPVVFSPASTTLAAGEKDQPLPRRDPRLASMRAGRALAPSVLAPSEREAMRAATSRAPHLDALRAGTLSNRDWQIIALTALAIVVLIIVF
jgi:hypothetical protein